MRETDKCNDNDKMLTSSYLAETHKQVADGKRTLTLRLKSVFCSDKECVESFQEAAMIGQQLKHPNILRSASPTPSVPIGTEVPMEPFNCVTLEEFLRDNPSFIAEGKELERIIHEVEEALDYLHGRGICQLDLHPRNILLTKGEKQVKLSNSLFAYVHLISHLGLEPHGFIAPELFGARPPADLTTCDTYALGKLILYLYDMGTLPFPYRRAVRRATDDDPARRPANITDFRHQVNIGRMMQTILRGFAWAVATLALVGVLFGLTTSEGEEDIHFVEPTADNTYIYDSISGQEYYLNDSAMAEREAALEREKERQMEEYNRKLDDIFKKKESHANEQADREKNNQQYHK